MTESSAEKRASQRTCGVSSVLRRVESEVDVAYKTNPLMSLPRSQAIWHFLAECEEIPFRVAIQSHRDGIVQDPLAVVDYVANMAKWPMIWLWQWCTPSDSYAPAYNDQYLAAHELAKLGHKYLDYQTVFTYASKDLLDLELRGKRIRAQGEIRSDTRLDAYDRMVTIGKKRVPDPTFMPWLRDGIERMVQVNDDRFEYSTDSRFLNMALARSSQILETRFRLPNEWKIGEFTLSDYLTVLRVLWCLCGIHLAARRVACDNACVGMGYLDSVLRARKVDLINKVSQYSGLSIAVTGGIIDQLTFGNACQDRPDIVLQPLVPLTSCCVGIAPSLVVNSHLERNLLVLLNRIEASRHSYSILSRQCETIHRNSIEDDLDGLGLRFVFGRVPGWGTASDLDLAIIDSERRCCLLLELKSFVEPADPREVYEKSREIQKGIRQVQRRRAMAATHRACLNTFLRIGDDYRVYLAVASEWSVACGLARADDVVLVRRDDLVARIRAARELRSVCAALERGDHLPREGVDYVAEPKDVEIEGWTLEWYGNRIL